MTRVWALGLAAGSVLALSACERVEWHLGQNNADDEAASLDEVAIAVEELTTEEKAANEPAPVEPVLIDLEISGDGVLAITGARIITMDGGVLASGTVLVKGGNILAVGANVHIPDGAEQLSADGLTMMPGLADMHVHHWSEAEGPLYLAHGITTVRNLWGTTKTIRLDQGAQDAAYAGPRVYSPGPLTDGPEPIWGDSSLVIETAEQAVGAVRAQKAMGFAAVKLYEKLPEAAYRAAVAEAKRLDMQVYTHTPGALSVPEVLALEVDSLEHMDDVDVEIASDSFKDVEGQSSYLRRWASADPGKIADLAAQFADHDVASSVTFAVSINRYASMLDAEEFWASEAAAYVPAATREWWSGSAFRAAPNFGAALVRDARAGQLAFVKALHDAGAPLLIGTDTPNPFVVQGFAMHDELAAFIEAGIPQAEVLRLATSGAAEFLGAEAEFGRIAAGLRADLLIVRGDPLTDISTLKRPVYVIAGGEVYNRAELDAMLADIAADVAASLVASE